MTPDWVRDAVFYQIFPDRFRRGDHGNGMHDPCQWGEIPTRTSLFGGDLAGIAEKLDYLQWLGVNALYLTPVFAAPSNHKYDTVDYFTVDPTFGGNDALRVLVDAVHARGMRIVLDGVFNHCSDRHPFFLDAISNGRASLYWDWFTIDGHTVQSKPEPNYECWAGVRTMPEWNHKNPDVEGYLLSVVRHWISEYAIDGWRLDTVEYLPPDFVRRIRQVARDADPQVYVVGEAMGIAAAWFKHDAIDGVMHYRLRDGLIHFLVTRDWSAETFAGFARSLWRSYPRENGFSCYTLIGSHDKPRFLTLAGGDKRRLLLAAAFLFSYPGAPAIYYGDEIGMEGGDDPDCRRAFPWDESIWDKDLQDELRTLVGLRNLHPALRRGEPRFLQSSGQYLVLSRILPEEEIVLALNAGEQEKQFSIEDRTFKDLASGEEGESFAVPGMRFRLLKRI